MKSPETSKTRPTRMCAGCRQNAPQTALIRLVFTAGDGWSLDLLNEHQGRGVYVHPRPACWAQLQRSKRRRAPLDWTVPDICSMIEKQLERDRDQCSKHRWMDGEGLLVEANKVTARMAQWNSWGESLGCNWEHQRGGLEARRGGLKGLAGFEPILNWSRF